MNHSTDSAENQQPSLGELNDLNVFHFKYDNENTPTKNIQSLRSKLSIYKIQFTSYCNLPKEDEEADAYDVEMVSMDGNSYLIASNFRTIGEDLREGLYEYTIGIESYQKKIFELTNCRFEIMNFLWEVKYFDPSIDTNKSVVYFNGTEPDLRGYKIIPFHQLNLTPEVKAEILNHLTVRNEVMSLLLDYLSILLEVVKVSQLDIELNNTTTENKDHQKKILQLWIALKEDGFLLHLKESEEAKYRSAFFNIFNLESPEYHSNRKNFKVMKDKEQFFKELGKKFILALNKNSGFPKKDSKKSTPPEG